MKLRHVLAALLVLASSIDLLVACSGASQSPPCATAPVARYTARMVAAGCTGEHFNDPQCAAIKAERDAEETDGGCK